jgi:hypothetical protein
MSVLRGIEGRIEGLFEGVFGRAFRTHVQPVELARKLVKEMDEHRAVSVSRVYVPNEYSIYLSAADRAQFASYEGSLVGELQEYLAEHAARENYALLTPPRVLVLTDEDLAVGEFGIATRVVQPADRPKAPDAPELPAVPTATVIYPPAAPAVVPVPVAEPVPAPPPVAAASLTMDGRSHPLSGERTVLGRSRECDVRVADTNVSRRHAELRREDDAFWIVDLGSTNGTELNGRRVERARVEDGDRITLGSTDLVFSRTSP